jgi:hypothetical protein
MITSVLISKRWYIVKINLIKIRNFDFINVDTASGLDDN